MIRRDRALRFSAVQTLLPLVCVAAVALSGTVDAAPPVEGEARLLALLRDAQQTNLTRFQQGRLAAQATEVRGESREEAVCELIWQGPNTYWKYSLRQVDSKGRKTEFQDARIIETPQKLISYFPESSLALVDGDKKRKYYDILRLRPDQCWFTVERREGNLWRDMLDPQKAPPTLRRFVVKKQEHDRAVVERHYSTDEVMTIIASFAQGGNIVSYQTLGGKGFPYSRKGQYEWSKHFSGVWYLRRMAHQWHPPGKPDEPVWEYRLEVTSFDPNPAIPANRFELRSLELPAGTTVRETTRAGEKTYRIGKAGQAEKKLSQRKLDQLADWLREKGFARPAEETNKVQDR